MTIKKYTGKTEEEVIQKAKLELGENMVIMSKKEVKPQGLFRVFKKSTYEITAAVEPKEKEISFTHVQKMVEEHVQQEEILKKGEAEQAETIETKLENLHQILSKQMVEEVRELNIQNDNQNKNDDVFSSKKNIAFIKALYDILILNEVDEKYINQMIEELEQLNWEKNNVDLVLSNIYQKMILKFGEIHAITGGEKKTKVIFFIGPTGVGKTTTIAKIASELKMKKKLKVAFLTADTYRIAAAEQLKIYANILDVPMEIIYTCEELNEKLADLSEYDLVLVDTAGFSHKNQEQKMEVKNLIQHLNEEYEREVYLVLSATTKYRDLKEIVDIYHDISQYHLIFTKLDETTSFGNILNIKLYSNSAVSYVTMGQNVPNDIEMLDSQKIVKRLLGGK